MAFCIFGVKIMLSFGTFSLLTTAKKVVVFRTAVKEGGAGGEGRKAASSNLSLNNSACCRNSSPLLFFKHFSPFQLVDSLRKGKCALFESPPCLFVLNRQRLRPPLPLSPSWQKLEVTAPNIFCLSPSFSPSAPSQSLCITDQGGEQLQKQRSLSASSSAHSSRRHWGGGRLYRVGVVPARPTQLPTGLPSNGERYLERRRRGRRERGQRAPRQPY